MNPSSIAIAADRLLTKLRRSLKGVALNVSAHPCLEPEELEEQVLAAARETYNYYYACGSSSTHTERQQSIAEIATKFWAAAVLIGKVCEDHFQVEKILDAFASTLGRKPNKRWLLPQGDGTFSVQPAVAFPKDVTLYVSPQGRTFGEPSISLCFRKQGNCITFGHLVVNDEDQGLWLEGGYKNSPAGELLQANYHWAIEKNLGSQLRRVTSNWLVSLAMPHAFADDIPCNWETLAPEGTLGTPYVEDGKLHTRILGDWVLRIEKDDAGNVLTVTLHTSEGADTSAREVEAVINRYLNPPEGSTRLNPHKLAALANRFDNRGRTTIPTT